MLLLQRDNARMQEETRKLQADNKRLLALSAGFLVGCGFMGGLGAYFLATSVCFIKQQ